MIIFVIISIITLLFGVLYTFFWMFTLIKFMIVKYLYATINRIANFMEDKHMEQITRVQIQESLDTYVKTYITDAEWHISLVEDFMHLLTGNSFNVTDLQDSRWIRTIIDNNKDNEYAKRILMRNMPETYISGLFNVVIRETNHVR